MQGYVSIPAPHQRSEQMTAGSPPLAGCENPARDASCAVAPAGDSTAADDAAPRKGGEDKVDAEHATEGQGQQRLRCGEAEERNRRGDDIMTPGRWQVADGVCGVNIVLCLLRRSVSLYISVPSPSVSHAYDDSLDARSVSRCSKSRWAWTSHPTLDFHRKVLLALIKRRVTKIRA